LLSKEGGLVMKKSLFISMILSALLAFTGSAWALSLVDVGGLDKFVDAAKLGNSSDADELSWVNGLLGTKYLSLVKYDTPKDATWQYLTDPNAVALQLKGIPEYFLIKTGNVGTFDHFLFKNSNDWAVVDLMTSFGDGYEIKNLGKFSHIDEIGSTPVPEPGTILLLGAGMFGLAIFGKRRMQA
jgi:hypothetical protein